MVGIRMVITSDLGKSSKVKSHIISRKYSYVDKQVFLRTFALGEIRKFRQAKVKLEFKQLLNFFCKLMTLKHIYTLMRTI